MTEIVPVILNPRDRFSTTARWLRSFLALDHDPDRFPVHVVMGGAPQHLRDAWIAEFGDRVGFDFPDGFLNQNASRNRVLETLDSRLVFVADNDCYPRPDCLERMVACQVDTGATMVVPLILEEERVIHCAGTDLYINEVDGRPMGHKVLRLSKYPYNDGCNLTRQPVDYGELHLMLVERQPALDLLAFDPIMQEVGEVDSGMTWSGAGLSMFVEPEAVAFFDLHGPMTVDDIDLYLWRWDRELVHDGYERFRQKWGLDITEEGRFEYYMVDHLSQIPLLARRFRSQRILDGSRALRTGIDEAVSLPRRLRNAARRRVHGGGTYAIRPPEPEEPSTSG